MDEVDEIVRGLSDEQREKLAAIMVLDDHFRLGEGEPHGPYTALTRRGILQSQNFSDVGTLYWLTATGLQVRDRLTHKEYEE